MLCDRERARLDGKPRDVHVSCRGRKNTRVAGPHAVACESNGHAPAPTISKQPHCLVNKVGSCMHGVWAQEVFLKGTALECSFIHASCRLAKYMDVGCVFMPTTGRIQNVRVGLCLNY